jgi:peptidyl-prolyl cis-trans isomerase D
MLQKLRVISKSWISGVFLGILSLAFVSWGVGDVFQGGINTAVITVGNTKVDQEEFQRDYNNLLRRIGDQSGTVVTPELAKREKYGDGLLQQTILDTAVNNVVHTLGLTASDAMITSQIRSMQQFSGPTGSFDKRTFEEIISRYGYTEALFIREMRDGLARAQLTQAAESGFAIPAGYARALIAYYAELRAFEYAVVTPEGLPPIAAPSDAVLAAYTKAHAGQYSTPEYRDVTYAKIAPTDLIDKVTVTDGQIRQAYDNQKNKYVVDEKRNIERLTFQNEKEAREASTKIKAGAKFADIAKNAGFKPEDLSLGDVVAKDLDAAAAKAVFALKAGGVTEPIKSDFGWSLFLVTRITPAQVTPLEKARDAIRHEVALELARAKLDDIANAYTDAVSAGSSLTEAATKAGLKVEHIAAMDKDGLAPDGSKTSAPDDAEFRAMVFKADIGEEGDPATAQTGTLYVIQANGQTPPKLKPLDRVRDRALTAWLNEQRVLLNKKRAQDLAALANKTKSLRDAAKTFGVSVADSKALQRNGTDDTFSRALLAAAFAAMPGTAVSGPIGKGSGYVVVRVTGIAHVLPPEKSDEYVKTVEAMSKDVGTDVSTSLAYAARDKQGVKINNKLFESAIGGGGEGS